MNKLLQNKFSVDYHDKFIKEIGQNRSYPNLKNKKNINISPNILKKYDLILLLTDHDYLNYNMIQKNSKLIIDTRNSFSNSKNQKDIIKM
jgi:UDP-N-acetyl-D-glucosamine dehydrogenase